MFLLKHTTETARVLMEQLNLPFSFCFGGGREVGGGGAEGGMHASFRSRDQL